MINRFKGISDAEYDMFKNAISLITVLIAGADGKIDSKERKWAEKVTTIRSFALPDGLSDFYKEVGTDFSERLDIFVERFDGDTETRNRKISELLAELNGVFPKMENREVAVALYQSLISFSKHVARASGGFLSWGSINIHEKRLMQLDMINPVEE